MGQVRTGINETGQALRAVLANPALRRINLALSGSMIGDWAAGTAVAVWAYQAGGATLVGIWGVIRLSSMAVASPFSAVLSDRYPRKTVMVVSDLTRVVLVLGAAAVVSQSGPSWLVILLATLAAVVATVFLPAKAALMPELASTPVELAAANGVGSTVESLAFFVGPAIAGTLLVFTGVAPVLVFNAATFVWSAVLVWGVHPPPRPEMPPILDAGGVPAEPESARATPTPGFLQESVAGFATIVSNRDLRLVTALLCAQTVVAGASVVFVVAVAVDLIDLGPQGVGYLESTLGIGALAGGLIAMARASGQRLAVDFGAGVILWALPLLLLAAWAHPLAAFACMFVIGVANPLVDVNFDTIVQRVTPSHVMGRVFGAVSSAFIAGMALGAALMPILIATVGLRTGLGIIGITVTLLVLPFMPRLHRMDGLLQAPEGLALIRGLPIFAPLSQPIVERLALALRRIEVPAGTAVITEGDVGDRFYIVESGRVEATYRGEHLSYAGPGEPFGEIALLHDVPRTASVTTVEHTVLRSLDQDVFLAAVTGNAQALDRTQALANLRIPTGERANERAR